MADVILEKIILLSWLEKISFQTEISNMASRILFYSWQSDSDERFNRYFIEDCLKRAIRQLNREDLSDLLIDRDTKNVPGMPDIGYTIMEKISKSSVVVADLTIINPAEIRRPNERPTSNPNVLFELGYAFGKLSSPVMIGIVNVAYGEIEELPFDLRPKRLMKFNLTETINKTEVRNKLVDDLASAIRLCLGESEEEQILQNSRIQDLLIDFRRLGSEIDQWYGIQTLSKILQSYKTIAHELFELISKRNYNQGIKNISSHLVADIEKANLFELNEENWPEIRRLVSSSGDYARFIQNLVGFKLDNESHDNLLQIIYEVLSGLDKHINYIQGGQYNRLDLEIVGNELRNIAFLNLIPQHPKFSAGLDEISLDLRKQVLKWAQNDPKKDEAIAILQDIRNRLSELLGKYASLPESLNISKTDAE